MMHIASVPSRTGQVTHCRQVDWAELARKVSTHTAGAKDGPGWLPALIEPGPRTAARVTQWESLALDIEGEAEKVKPETAGEPERKRLIGPPAPPLAELAAELELRGWAAALATSYSHEEPAADAGTLGPRYRLVMPVSRPIKPEEIRPLCEALSAMLGVSDCVDTGCFEPARLFYGPRAPAERLDMAESRIIDGEPLPVDDVLGHARAMLAPQRKPGGEVGNVIAAFNARADVAAILERNGYEPKGRNRWVWEGSTTGMAGVVRLPESGRIYSHHGGDKLAGAHSHDAFSVWCELECGGDVRTAVRKAADWLGIKKASNTPAPAPSEGAGAPQDAGMREDAGPHPLARFVAIDAEPRPPSWVIPGFIARGVCVVAGGHGVGKTTALLPLAMAAAGLHEADYPLAPFHWRHVVYITEDAEQAGRIVAGLSGHLGLEAGAVRERLHIVEAQRLAPAFVAEVGSVYRQQFTRTVQDVEVPPLVVIDTLAATIHLESENDNAEASAAIAAMKQDFAGLPIWLVGHVAKTNLSRAEAAGLSLRGASAFEADAHQVLFLVREGEARWLVRGKTRFEARWPELQLDSHFQNTMARNEFGDMEPLTLRWAIARPAEGDRRAMAEAAKEEQRKADEADLRDAIRNAVQVAWQAGNPLNREGVKATIARKRNEVSDCLERLVAERWLCEVFVPAKERANPNKKFFLVNLGTEEHEAVTRGEPLPAAKLVIPASWKKPESAVPDSDSENSAGGDDEHQ